MSRQKKTDSRNGARKGATPARTPSPTQLSASQVQDEQQFLARGRRAWIIGTAVLAATIAVAVVFWAQRDRPPAAAPAPVAVTDALYAGGAECAGCHAKEHAAWKGSDHDLAMQVADEKSVLGNFVNAKFSYAGTTSTFFRRDGKFFVNTDGPDGRLSDYEIKYTFGVRPLQQYLIEFPGGRMQALSIAWDSRPKAQGGQRWFHLYPGQNVKAGDWLHWTAGGQNWNFTCAECHSTNLKKNYDATSDTYGTKWAEINVSCEACHGPGSNHVAWAKKQGDWQVFNLSKGLALALDERKGVVWMPVTETGNAKRNVPRQSAREIETCARCHGRASRISDDYVHGRPPQDTHRLALLDDNLYWDDGQMRDEVYNWGSFVQSKMHAQGVTCSDCHEPHSLKLREPGNGACARCHASAKFDAPAHTHHAAGTAGAACAACHMPTTTYMVIDPRHDHSLRVPRPDLSAKLGMPNACSNCHTKQKPQWAADAIARWTGRTPIGYQRFAEALRAGATGAPGARGALLTVIDDREQPAIVRASAIQRLGHWLTPSTIPRVTLALNDPDPVVRLAAVEALANLTPSERARYLARMLGDPVRAVRVEAARAIAGPAEAELPADARAAFDRAQDEYIAVQRYNADRPEGRLNLGNLHLQHRDAEHAAAEYRKAIELDSTFVQAYANLADLERARGAEREAETVLRAGIARVPNAAVLHYALGLALVRQKRADDALRELAEAVRLDPAHTRYAYVYAVALQDTGRRDEVTKVLTAAQKRDPYDRDILTALARHASQTGDHEAALRYVRQLRELDPEDASYNRLAEQIGAR